MRTLISLLTLSLLLPISVQADSKIDIEYVRAMKATKLRNLDLEDIFKLAEYGVQPKYVKGLKSMGLRNFDADDALKLAKSNITLEYVRAAKSIPMGKYFDANDVLKMHSQDVTTKYLKGLKSAHVNRLYSFDENDAIKLYRSGAPSEYIHNISNLGLRNFDADDVIKLYKADVSPQYAHDMKKVGLRYLDEDDLVKLSNANVTPKFAREAKSIGMNKADEVIKLAQKFDGKAVELAAAKPKPKSSRRESRLDSITDRLALIGLIMLICYVAYRLFQKRSTLSFATPQNDIDYRITHFEKRVGDLQDILISIDDRLNRQIKRT